MAGFIKSLNVVQYNMEEVKTRFNDGRAPDMFLDRCIAEGVPLRIDLGKTEQLKKHRHFYFLDYIGLSSWYVQAFTDTMQSVFFGEEWRISTKGDRNVEQETDHMVGYVKSKLPKVMESYGSVGEFKLLAVYNMVRLGLGSGNRRSLDNMLILNNTPNWAEDNEREGRMDYLRRRAKEGSDYDRSLLKMFAEKLKVNIPEMVEIGRVYEIERVLAERFVGLSAPWLFGAVDAFKETHESVDISIQMIGYAGHISIKNLKLLEGLN